MLTKKQMQSLPAGRHLIEPNLYLRVRSATSKYFTFKYALNGSRKELTLGKFEDLTVSQAREQVAKCRLLLAKGIDPKFAKEKQKKSIKDVQQKQLTFKQFYDKILPDILNAKPLHGDNSKRKYTHMPYTYLMPALGKMPISEIKTADILRCLKPLWFRIPPTALKEALQNPHL